MKKIIGREEEMEREEREEKLASQSIICAAQTVDNGTEIGGGLTADMWFWYSMAFS